MHWDVKGLSSSWTKGGFCSRKLSYEAVPSFPGEFLLWGSPQGFPFPGFCLPFFPTKARLSTYMVAGAAWLGATQGFTVPFLGFNFDN